MIFTTSSPVAEAGVEAEHEHSISRARLRIAKVRSTARREEEDLGKHFRNAKAIGRWSG